MDLKNRVALVTGASSGIGQAVAISLAKEGVRVAVTARRKERLQELLETIAGAGGRAFAHPADLRKPEEIQALFAAMDSEFGQLDILINNAGLARWGSMQTGDPEGWREMFDVNVLALCIATQEALRRFPPEGGHIVNISSMAGHRVPPNTGLYSATKHAATAITEITRQELRQQESPTRVTQISPGFVATEFFIASTGSVEESDRILRSAVEKPLQPDDIAASVLHALQAPPHVSIHDILVRPTSQRS